MVPTHSPKSIHAFLHAPPCDFLSTLLEWASSGGSYALLDSSLPSLPRAVLVTYNAGPFQGQGTLWNLSCTGWRLLGDLPMRPGETLSLTVALPNEQRIEIPEVIVRWSKGTPVLSYSTL